MLRLQLPRALFWAGLGVEHDDQELHDVLTIADMLIPLGLLTDREVNDRIVRTLVTSSDPDHAGERFTCRHLQPNGDCGNYEDRPGMCREYPYYGHACEYADCCDTRLREERTEGRLPWDEWKPTHVDDSPAAPKPAVAHLP